MSDVLRDDLEKHGTVVNEQAATPLPTSAGAAFELVSVVIPVYNPGPAIFAEQLTALSRQTYPGRWELVLAENGCTDGTMIAVPGLWKLQEAELRVVDASNRKGASYARNVGAAAARGDLLVFCDADDVADVHWLECLVAALSTAELVSGRQEYTRLNTEVHREWHRKWRGHGDRGMDEGLERQMGFLPLAPSSNLAVRKDLWERIGRWNEEYPYSEDVEFSWRAQLADARIVYAPDAVIHKRLRASLLKMGWQVFRHSRANARLYRDYRCYGARCRSATELLRSYLYVLTRFVYLGSSRRRGCWVAVTAANLGRLVGSIDQRVLFL